jgi:hypothetical protein
MVNVTNRANVHMRLVALKLFLGHFLLHLRPEGPVAVFVRAGVPACCDQANFAWIS